ncbi:MAG: autoinducer-2 kinase [Sulfurospirillaceae bacterium]|nr:autoinducer-2 kinase [Sulfurospirillaceae bacterium]
MEYWELEQAKLSKEKAQQNKERYIMSIDAGTGSVRAVIFNLDGVLISVGQEEWSHYEQEGIANSMNFDCKQNWPIILRCITTALKKANIHGEQIIAVSAASMREGIVLYDKDLNEIFAVANVDARAEQEVVKLKEVVGLEEKYYEKSGQTFALGALPRLLWVKRHQPLIYEKIFKISMLSDWILFKLSGVIASEPSNAGTSGIFSLHKREWFPKMASKIGIKDTIFPPCYESGTVLGKVTCRDSKLGRETLVVVGGGDIQMASLGLGLVDIGDTAIIGGTFWQQVRNIPSTTIPPLDMSMRINPHVISGQSQAEGITFFSGLVMRWFRDVFCESEKELAKERKIDPYTILEEMASAVPAGSNGVLPIFSDSMKYYKWYHASPSFLNLSIDPKVCNKSVMFRSLQENACIVSWINLKNIEKFTDTKTKEIVFAGGASKGALWCQILADVTGLKVKVPVIKEATSLGVAIVAGFGAGAYRDISIMTKKLVKWEKTYLPNPQNHEIYKDVRKRWQKAYEAQLKLVDEGVTTSMWKSPGMS